MKSFVKHDLEKNDFGEETTKEMMENEEEKGNVLTITFWFVIIVVVDVLIFGSTWRRRWSCLEEETLKSFHWNVKWAPVIEYFYFGWSVSYENSMKNHRELASEGRPVNHQVDHLPHNSLQWKYYHSISAHIRVWLLLWKKNVHLGLFLWKTTILRRNHVSDINEIGRFPMITKLVHMIRRVILEMEEEIFKSGQHLWIM